MTLFRFLVTFCLTVAAGLLGFMINDRQPPLIRYYGRITPDNPLPGADINVTWEVRKNRDCPGVIYRRIIDSHGVVYDFAPVESLYTLAANTKEFSRLFKLPAQIAPGPAEYFATNKLVCNPLHNFWPILVDMPSIKFNIATPPN